MDSNTRSKHSFFFPYGLSVAQLINIYEISSINYD